MQLNKTYVSIQYKLQKYVEMENWTRFVDQISLAQRLSVRRSTINFKFLFH